MNFSTPAKRRDWFSGYYAGTVLVYFLVIMGCSMLYLHPAFLVLSFLGAAGYGTMQSGFVAGGKRVCFALVILGVITLINPLVNHQGLTVLAYWGDMAITLEAILFGCCSAAMLVSVVLWFMCFHQVLSSERLLYILSPYLPATAMVLTMALGLVPRLSRKLKQITQGRKGIGKGTANALSILTTWAFEDGLITADAMKARGYGDKRSRYPKEFFTWRDGAMLAGLVLAAALLGVSGISGMARAQFFPDIFWRRPPVWLLVLYGSLCALPMLVNGWEELRWRYLRRKSLPFAIRKAKG